MSDKDLQLEQKLEENGIENAGFDDDDRIG